jgi:hypothetical protein
VFTYGYVGVRTRHVPVSTGAHGGADRRAASACQPLFVLDQSSITEEATTMAMSIEDVQKAEKLIKERRQIVAATWTHVAGLGSESGYGPEGRA